MHWPGFSGWPGETDPTHRSVKVMVASWEKKRSTDGVPADVPWLQIVTITWTWDPAGALGVVLTWVTTKSGLFPTPIGLPAVALLSSISSTTPLLRSTMAPGK